MLGPNIRYIETDNEANTIVFFEQVLGYRYAGRAMNGVVLNSPNPGDDSQVIVGPKGAIEIDFGDESDSQVEKDPPPIFLESYSVSDITIAEELCRSLSLNMTDVNPSEHTFRVQTPWGTWAQLKGTTNVSTRKDTNSSMASKTADRKPDSLLGEPIRTAASFYREMKRRGLHLRRGKGRDDALLTNLSNRIGCPDMNVQSFLDKSGMPAEEFVLHFMELAQPFALMFKEIWEYLSAYTAYKTSESIAVRFGFPEENNPTVVTLNQFRRYVQKLQRFESIITLILHDR